MATVRVDKVETLETKEVAGSPIRVVRGYVVSGLVSTNWNVADEAQSASGVPAYGDRLSSTPGEAGYSLICNERGFKLMGDRTIGLVTCVFENAFSVDYMEDSYDAPFLGSMGGEVRCSVQQKNTNLDGNGDQIIVAHQYPDDDDNYPGAYREQGGEISFFDTQRSFTLHGIKWTNAPWAIANACIGRVNSVWFSGEAPRMWFCVACNWKPESTINGSERYAMRFEFSFNPDSWDPTVVYTDDTTGKPPKNLVQGVGIKTIEKLPAADFEYIIGTWIYGG